MSDSYWLLIAMAFLLGIRHGFDLDHLATIDSMTRTFSGNKYLSRMTGFLFSLGHGLVVILISLVIGSGFRPSHVPEWLDGVGEIISILFLFLFGLLNLWSVLQPAAQPFLPKGLKSYLFKKCTVQQYNPFFIMLVGVLFALSFDTVSQVVLFSLSASALAGVVFTGLMGVFFMLGMMTSDGLNGMIVSHLIQRADGFSVLFSRFIGFLVALFSLMIGLMKCVSMT